MDEITRLARQHAPEALKTLARIADDPSAKNRAKARKQLKSRVPLLRQLCVDPTLSDSDRRDLEAILKKLTAN
jgi:hypothetical protein